MDRRQFLGQISGVAGLAAEAMGAQTAHRRRRRVVHPAVNPRLARVGISSWSFHNYFRSTRQANSPEPQEWFALLDFPAMIADRYKVHNLEFVAPHFASGEQAYIVELKRQLTRARSRLINIPVDIKELWTQGGLSDPSPAVRATAVAAVKQWIDIAHQLGARSVRADPGKMDPENLAPTVDSYKQLAAYGRTKGVDVIIENHGGVGSEHPSQLVRLFNQVGGKFIGALPDFGNFPDEATRLRGLKILFPYALSVCHAKGLDFDAAGAETRFDFPQCVAISKAARFKGVYSIEYEGSANPYDGVQKVVNELVKYL